MDDLYIITGALAVLLLICIFKDLFPSIGPYLAAKRIGLRDRGKTKWRHSFCGHYTRIGIHPEGYPVEYCWLCEEIVDDDGDDDDPGPGSEMPDDFQENSEGKVISFPEKKAA